MFFREFDIPLKEIKSVMENPALDRNQIFIEHYGSMDAFKEQFLKNASSEQAQMNFAKVVEWYGNKEKPEIQNCDRFLQSSRPTSNHFLKRQLQESYCCLLPPQSSCQLP